MKYKIYVDYFNLEWYKDGQYHRLFGPAVEYFDGDRWCFVNGILHRLSRPTVEYVNGDQAWYIDGKFCTKEQFLKILPNGSI